MRQFIEPCKQLEWDSKETEMFLTSLVDTCSKLDSLHRFDVNLNLLFQVLERHLNILSQGNAGAKYESILQ